MHTWTNQPYETMWNHLLFFSRKSAVSGLLTGQIQSNRQFDVPSHLLERKSGQVAYAIHQAHEYFKAADTVTINTSPLLYFYGMLSLAKALIVAVQPNTLLEAIPYHGLATTPPKGKYPHLESYVKDHTQWRMDKEYAITKGGVFQELTKTTDEFTFPDDAVIRYKDLLAINPELAQMYARYYGEKPRVQSVGCRGSFPCEL